MIEDRELGAFETFLAVAIDSGSGIAFGHAT
jgi:hypothetical protein